jgi:UDP-N-acetylmuramoyl-tripeptide--D-alanyl-D-alanine ligase
MLQNQAQFEFSDLLILFGEKSLYNISAGFKSIGVSSDSREVVQGNIFVALKGENFDGHDKIKEAFEKGAVAAVIAQDWFENNKTVFQNDQLIIVNNSLTALQTLANHHRRRFSYPIIAIGGSNGKTTTKDMTAHILSKRFNVLRTYENFNNQIGLPLMLLSLTNEFDSAVLEIGTNEPGEIAILSKILEPTHGLITNIGKEHLEKLINLDGVEMEETFLFGYLYSHAGTPLINFNDLRLQKYADLFEKKVTFGTTANAELVADINFDRELHPRINFKYSDLNFKVELKTAGNTTALNAIAATAVALHFGMSPLEITEALESFTQPAGKGYGRMLIEKINGQWSMVNGKWSMGKDQLSIVNYQLSIINDCYNANPSSMKEAFFTLKNIHSEGKRIAVLGDMRELGESSFDEHVSVIEDAAKAADIVLLIGSEMGKAHISLNLDTVFYFEDKELLFNHLKCILEPRDTVLVKGSRGMRMEEIIERLKIED